MRAFVSIGTYESVGCHKACCMGMTLRLVVSIVL